MFADLHTFFEGHRLLLAPMAGITDGVMRQLACEQGCDLAYSEMVSAKGLSYNNGKTHDLVQRYPGESLIAVQLFGHEPDTMAAEAQRLEDELGNELAYIDVNMGCPARKIVKKGDGSALMKSPDLAADVVRAINGAVEHPVTVKFRRGYATDDETCVDLACRMEDAGASAVAVHGRFAAQMYKGKSDRSCITRVAEAVSIPVIGNGDVFDGEDAVALKAETGCSAVMIARGALGNPWIFADAKACLDGGSFEAPTVEERIALARRHAHLLGDLGKYAIVRMRKHAMWYVAGLPGASVARSKFNYCSSVEDFDLVFDELMAHLSEAKG